LIGKLVEHLTSGSTLKKQIVIVVLRRSIPPDVYQDLITTIVKSDTDPEVRKTALEQARTLRDVAPSVAQAIEQAAEDENRPSEERQLATNAVRQIGLAAAAPANTWVFAASGDAEVSVGSDEFNGSVFTHHLLRGLSGEASINKDGNVSLEALSLFVRDQVMSTTQGEQRPVVGSPADNFDPIIVGPLADYSKIVSVVIGNSGYKGRVLPRQRFGATDARAFAQFWQDQEARTGGSVSVDLVVDGTRSQMLQALNRFQRQADRNSLAMFYYSGHAITIEGQGWLLPVDSEIGDVNSFRASGISTADVRAMLSRSSARTQVIFIDAAYVRKSRGAL
jgi:hypothetical protein